MDFGVSLTRPWGGGGGESFNSQGAGTLQVEEQAPKPVG